MASETRLAKLESTIDGMRQRASSMRRNWEASTLRVINSAEAIAVAAALGKMEKEDILQGTAMGLKLEHGVLIGSALIAVVSDDDTLSAHAGAFATGAGAVVAYKKMAE